jgi:hypothetical protein
LSNRPTVYELTGEKGKAKGKKKKKKKKKRSAERYRQWPCPDTESAVLQRCYKRCNVADRINTAARWLVWRESELDAAASVVRLGRAPLQGYCCSWSTIIAGIFIESFRYEKVLLQQQQT